MTGRTDTSDGVFDVDAEKDFPSRSREFTIDDAFSDGGEDELEFTTDSIRVDLAYARAMDETNADNYDEIRIEHSLENPDASVSTIDIDAVPAHALSPPASPSRGAVEFHLSYQDTVSGKSRSSSLDEAQDRVSLALAGNGLPKPSALQPTSLSSTPPELASEHSEASTGSNTSIPDEGQTPKAPIPTSYSLPVGTQTPRLQLHRPTKSTGPSALEKVLSKTRPTFLPPKAKQEDNKHMADWEAMMKHSRVAEERKKKLKQERRLARERAVEESTIHWEQHILPDWKNAIRDTNLRKLWWNGIPPKLRGIVWEKAIGNGLALSKDTYRTCLARALRALASSTFPTTTLNLIDSDIRSTLPTLHIFNPTTGPLYQDLKDLLCAWVVARSDEGLGYTMGASKIAAMFLLNMQPSSAFVSMRNLLERHCMRSFYGGLAAKDDVEAYCRIFDTLLADCMPKIYFNFKQHQVSPAAYLPEWLIPLFLDHLPLEACARIWDVLVLEGDSFLFRAALSILAVLEPRLFFPDRQELLGLLSGENKAALEVAKRDGNNLGSCKYEIYNVDEENIWEEIETLEDWWKESTWTRLIQRELPDL
ncbi:hypothetical protein M0805_003786 [Coniferiporia weirii]|nr:hypothetical protein M0805_003786 [Coniferiporia weirii]